MGRKTTIIFGATFGVFVLLLVGLLSLAQWLQNRNEAVAEERIVLENEVALMRSMQQVRRSVLSSVDEQQEINTFFVNQDSIPYFLGTLEAVAAQTNVLSAITRVNLAADRESLGVALSASGSFSSIHQYVKALEYTPFRITINSVFLGYIPVTEGAGQELGGQWRADIELTLQSYSEEGLPDINQSES